jgi:hypothetical protein
MCMNFGNLCIGVLSFLKTLQVKKYKLNNIRIHLQNGQQYCEWELHVHTCIYNIVQLGSSGIQTHAIRTLNCSIHMKIPNGYTTHNRISLCTVHAIQNSEVNNV